MKKNFWKSEEGAVTVDWGVLTATVIGISIATTAAVRNGTEELSYDIAGFLKGIIVSPGTGPSWTALGLNQDAVASGRKWMTGFSNQQLLDHMTNLDQYKDIAKGAGHPYETYHDEFYIARDIAIERGLI